LTVVPDAAAGAAANPVEWDVLLRAAGLDPPGAIRLAPAESATPTTYADRTAVWEGHYPERPEVRIRVEAGTYRGRPVYFRIIHPAWEDPNAPLETVSRNPQTAPSQILATFGVVIVVGVLVTLFVLAVRNLRRGRGDARGAARLAGALVVGWLVNWGIGDRHFGDLRFEYILFLQTFGNALGAAFILALGYLALEPVMRRRCPYRLTALARVLDGRFRDPLVGRDLLLGLALGVVTSADTALLPYGLTEFGPIVLDSQCFTKPVWYMVLSVTVTISAMWAVTSIFLVFSLVVRRDGVAAALLAVFLAAVTVGPIALAVGSAWMVPGSLLRMAVAVFLLFRFGVLALLGWGLVAFSTQLMPLTLDPSAWYLNASLTKVLTVTVLAGYGAWVSVGSRSLFGQGIPEDD
jgi:serine/threonine-protein kinase